jgi:hypothetical protein
VPENKIMQPGVAEPRGVFGPADQTAKMEDAKRVASTGSSALLQPTSAARCASNRVVP